MLDHISRRTSILENEELKTSNVVYESVVARIPRIPKICSGYLLLVASISTWLTRNLKLSLNLCENLATRTCTQAT